MNIEQTRPNKPNFLRVALLSAAAILLIALIALAIVGFDGKRLLPHAFTRMNTSRLVLPASLSTQLG